MRRNKEQALQSQVSLREEGQQAYCSYRRCVAFPADAEL